MDNIVINAIEDAVKQFDLGALPDTSQQNNLIELIKQIENEQERGKKLAALARSENCSLRSRINAISAIGEIDASLAFQITKESLEQGDKGNIGAGYGPKFNLQILNKTIGEPWFEEQHQNIDNHIRAWADSRKNSDEELRSKAQDVILSKGVTSDADARLILQTVADEIASEEFGKIDSLSRKVSDIEANDGEFIKKCVELLSADLTRNKTAENKDCWKSLGILKTAGYDVSFERLPFGNRLANGFKYEWKPLDDNEFKFSRILLISASCVAVYVLLFLLSGLLSPEAYVVWFVLSLFAMSVITLVGFDFVTAPISKSPDRWISLLVELVRSAIVAAAVTILLLLMFFILLPKDFASILGYQSNVDFSGINGFWIWLSIILVRPISSLVHEWIKFVKSGLLEKIDSGPLRKFVSSEISTTIFKIVVASATGTAILMANVFFNLGGEDYYESFVLVYGIPVLLALSVMYSIIDLELDDKQSSQDETRFPKFAAGVGALSFVFCFIVVGNGLGNWKKIETHNLSDKAIAMVSQKDDADKMLHRQALYFGTNYTFETDYLVRLAIKVKANEYKDIQVKHSLSAGVVDGRNGKHEIFNLGYMFSNLELCVAPAEKSSMCIKKSQEGSLAHVVTLVTNLLDVDSSSDLAMLEICDANSAECTRLLEEPTEISSDKKRTPYKDAYDSDIEEEIPEKNDKKNQSYWASIKQFNVNRRLFPIVEPDHGEFNIAVQLSRDQGNNARLAPGTVLYALDENLGKRSENEDTPQINHLVVLGLSSHTKTSLSAVDGLNLKNVNFEENGKSTERAESTRFSINSENRVDSIKQWLDVSAASGEMNFLSFRHPLYYPTIVYGLFEYLPLLDKLEVRKNSREQSTEFEPTFLMHYDHEGLDTFVSGNNWKQPEPYTLYEIVHQDSSQYIASPYFGRLPGTLRDIHNKDCIRFDKNSPHIRNIYAIGKEEVERVKEMIVKMHADYEGNEDAAYSKFYLDLRDQNDPENCSADKALMRDYIPSDVYSTSSIADETLKLVTDQVYRLAGSDLHSSGTISVKLANKEASNIADFQIIVRSLNSDQLQTVDEFGRESSERGQIDYVRGSDYLICIRDANYANACEHIDEREPKKEQWLHRRLKSARYPSNANNVVTLTHTLH